MCMCHVHDVVAVAEFGGSATSMTSGHHCTLFSLRTRELWPTCSLRKATKPTALAVQRGKSGPGRRDAGGRHPARQPLYGLPNGHRNVAAARAARSRAWYLAFHALRSVRVHTGLDEARYAYINSPAILHYAHSICTVQ